MRSSMKSSRKWNHHSHLQSNHHQSNKIKSNNQVNKSINQVTNQIESNLQLTLNKQSNQIKSNHQSNHQLTHQQTKIKSYTQNSLALVGPGGENLHPPARRRRVERRLHLRLHSLWQTLEATPAPRKDDAVKQRRLLLPLASQDRIYDGNLATVNIL